MTDEAFRQALRDHKSDVSDVYAFGRLVVAFWRAGLHDEDKRPLQIQFKLRKTTETKASSDRALQPHPWSKSRGRSRGFWWTIGPGNWRKPDGRAWIVPCTDAGWQTWSNANYSKPFAAIGELVDYMTGRAVEWRVVEKKARPLT